MNDCISKASVCEILSDIYPTDGEKIVEIQKIDKAYDAVLALPSAEPKWIPSSESKYDSWMINHESGLSKLRVFACATARTI